MADGRGATTEDAVARLQPPLGRPTPVRAVGKDTQGAAELSTQNPTVRSSAGPADPASVVEQRGPSPDLLDSSFGTEANPLTGLCSWSIVVTNASCDGLSDRGCCSSSGAKHGYSSTPYEDHAPNCPVA